MLWSHGVPAFCLRVVSWPPGRCTMNSEFQDIGVNPPHACRRLWLAFLRKWIESRKRFKVKVRREWLAWCLSGRRWKKSFWICWGWICLRGFSSNWVGHAFGRNEHIYHRLGNQTNRIMSLRWCNFCCPALVLSQKETAIGLISELR